MTAPAWLWWLFAGGILAMLAVDLGILNRKAHAVSMREAAAWVCLWCSLAMAFAGLVLWVLGRKTAMQFLAGYILELSLSVDNMFVFVMIFHYFAIPPLYQPRVLHWGILGAILMRFVFIFAGIGLINAFHWMIYVFGALLIITGAKMALQKDEHADPSRNPALRLLKKAMPITHELQGQDFFVRSSGVLHATPLFAALLVVEFSDVIFALDSVPAIIAITPDPFIVYTSNIFAIMGLRALYFLLSGLVGLFRYLKIGISLILVFVGIKMIISPHYPISIELSLAVIAATIAASIAASIVAGPAKPERGHHF